MTDTPYPEHEKLKAIQDKTQLVGDFLEWLTECNYVLGRVEGDAIEPTVMKRDDFLAMFFDIDRDRLEHEKRTMLKELRDPAPPTSTAEPPQ